MATFGKVKLSGAGSKNKGILIAATSTGSGATTIHATGTSSSILDEVWLYASNTSTSSVKLSIEIDAAAAAGDLIEFTVAAESGLYLVCPGLIFSGDGTNAATIRAWAATTNVINIYGYVNRITP